MKDFADDSFKFDENGGNFIQRVENITWTGEIACYAQYVFFPQCFPAWDCVVKASKEMPYFYAHVLKIRGILFYRCPSVCQSAQT